jgi:CBS domain-containing protein
MANNPQWNQPLEAWKSHFSRWINDGTPQDILEAAIFFDFKYIYGDKALVNHLRIHVNEVSDNKSVFFYHMAQSVLKYKPPINIFGQIKGDESRSNDLRLDIKKAMMPVISFLRLYAIRQKLDYTNSMERLEALMSKHEIDRDSYEVLSRAFNEMMHLRLRFQVDQISNNEIPNNILYISKLNKTEHATLKGLFSDISTLQSTISFEFKGGE